MRPAANIGSRGSRRWPGWLALLGLVGGLLPPGLAAAEAAPTRAAYVASLEGICKPNALATQRVMKGVRADLRAERLGMTAKKFSRATEIFAKTVREISVVPQPPADEARLSKWFIYLGRQTSYLKKITAQLRASHTIRAQRLTARFIHNGNLANNTVLAFGFNYCSFKFSRYG